MGTSSPSGLTQSVAYHLSRRHLRFLSGSVEKHRLVAAAGRALASEAALAASESSAAQLRAELAAALESRDAERATRDELEARIRLLGSSPAAHAAVASPQQSSSVGPADPNMSVRGTDTAPLPTRVGMLDDSAPQRTNIKQHGSAVVPLAAADAARAVVERIAATRLPRDGEWFSLL